jgi:hypothetical protein
MNSVHAPSKFLKSYFNIVLHLRLGLQRGLFRSDFPTKILFEHLPNSATCAAQLIFVGMITRIILFEEYILKIPLCLLFHAPVTSTHLVRNIFLNTLFSKTVSLRSSLDVTDQVSHPYKQTSLNRKSYKSGFMHLLVEMAPSVILLGIFSSRTWRCFSTLNSKI